MFDIGQTLLDNKQPPVQQIMQNINISKNKKDILKKILFTMDYGNDVNGLVRNIEYRCGIEFELKDKVSLMEIIRHQELESFPMKGSKEFTNSVIDSEFEYCLVSNIWGPFYRAFRDNFIKFNLNAKKKYLSHEMGCRKPYGEFYRKVIDDLGYNVSNLCIIGDHWDNDIIPMLKLGGKAIWFNHKLEELPGIHKNLYSVTTYEQILAHMDQLQHVSHRRQLGMY